MNIYRHTFWARCPSDGAMISYRLVIRSQSMVRVEAIKAAAAKHAEGFHEDIADALHADLGGAHSLVATHQLVEVETLR